MSTEEKLHRTHSGMDFSEKADNGELPALLSSLPTLRLSLPPFFSSGKEGKKERGREETERSRERDYREERETGEERKREKRERHRQGGGERRGEKRGRETAGPTDVPFVPVVR